MKNIHVLPTHKPSRLGQSVFDNSFHYNPNFYELEEKRVIPQNIYITSDVEIKEGEKDFYIIANDRDKTWINRIEKVIECKIDPKHGKVLILSSGFIYIDEGCKIILTTDQDLIKDGVQEIDETFLDWFVKNPSCECVKTYWNPLNSEYDFMIPKEEPKQTVEQYEQQGLEKYAYEFQQETLEEAAKRYSNIPVNRVIDTEERYYNPNIKSYDSFIEGAKWQAERMYTEEETLKFGEIMAWNIIGRPIAESSIKIILKQLFKQFKK
jgi:hypothetical protein